MSGSSSRIMPRRIDAEPEAIGRRHLNGVNEIQVLRQRRQHAESRLQPVLSGGGAAGALDEGHMPGDRLLKGDAVRFVFTRERLADVRVAARGRAPAVRGKTVRNLADLGSSQAAAQSDRRLGQCRDGPQTLRRGLTAAVGRLSAAPPFRLRSPSSIPK